MAQADEDVDARHYQQLPLCEGLEKLRRDHMALHRVWYDSTPPALHVKRRGRIQHLCSQILGSKRADRSEFFKRVGQVRSHVTGEVCHRRNQEPCQRGRGRTLQAEGQKSCEERST